jgi:FAD:protein FMN transferase
MMHPSIKFHGITASLVLAVPFVAMLLSSCGSASKTEEVQSDRQAASLQEHRGEAQGTTYSIKYVSELRLEDAVFEDILEMIDREVSLWRPLSRINQINAWDRTDALFGFVDSTQIIGPLWALSEELHGLTRGAFDPTVSPLVELWGFGFSEMGEVGADQVDSVMSFIGMVPDRFDMNEEEEDGYYKSTWVRKGDPRAALDFNAIAQGYSVDLLLEALRERGITDAMVELGGEVVCRGSNASGGPWRIAVDRPIEGSTEMDRTFEMVVAVQDRAICTSGSYRKFHEVDGRKISHTIDPGTGWPAANGLLSATVLAPTGAYADAMATAFMVLGEEQTKGFLNLYPELGLDVLLMSDDGQGGYSIWSSPGFEAVSSRP